MWSHACYVNWLPWTLYKNIYIYWCDIYNSIAVAQNWKCRQYYGGRESSTRCNFRKHMQICSKNEGMFLKTLPLKNAHSRFSVHLRLLCEWQQREIFNFCYELKVETEIMNMIKLDLQYDEQPTCFTDSLQSCHLQLNCWSFKCHTQREIFLKIIILATVKPVNSFYS